ncbi:transcriptional activator [Xylariales sp. AK1849]|nr:transcriptional activator [Xylariales sp. AK1849]
MSSPSNTGKAGVIKAVDDTGSMDKVAHSVLDDLLYNIVHDLLIKVHRDEKIARASTAAIRVEKLASDASDSSLTDSRPDVKVETDAAIYDEGKVLLKGNPLATTKDIVCPSCHLPRLLYPTDGKGAKKPDPSIIYCKKHPYIEKPGYDIYGQTWVAQGPGRGKKKKDMEKKPETTSQDTPGGTPGPEELKGGASSRPPNVLSFPSATCSKCKRCILVTRLNNHMGSCIGNSGRHASRAAAQKISNGSNGAHNGSQGDNTPPNSQKGTPLPGSRANSPKKRDGDEMDDDDDSDDDTVHKKKKLKPSAANSTKKVVLKSKGSGAGGKKDKVKANSLLSVEQKVDDDDDAEGSTVEVAPKKKITKHPNPAKKLKLGVSKPLLSSPATKNGKTSNGGGGGGEGDDAESESSGTLSSPPVV